MKKTSAETKFFVSSSSSWLVPPSLPPPLEAPSAEQEGSPTPPTPHTLEEGLMIVMAVYSTGSRLDDCI